MVCPGYQALVWVRTLQDSMQSIRCGSQGTGNQRQSCSVLWSHAAPAACHRNILPAAMEQLGGSLPGLSECWEWCLVLSEFPTECGICFCTKEPMYFKEGKVKVAQSCLTLCIPMDYTVHGILQARILEWAVFPFSRGSSQPRDRTQVSRIAGRFFSN